MRFQFASLLLYNSPFNDAILEFNDGFLPVSRMILASHSEKFYLLFCENPKQAHFKDLNMKLKDFEVYYEYLHLDTHFKVDGDKMVSIMKVQAALQVYDLRLQIDNWLLSRQFASHLGSLFEKTKNKVLAKQHYLTRQIIGSNLKELCTVKAFGTFSRDNFLSFLNRDFIKTKDQGVLLEIIGQWVMYAFDTRKSDWLPLVKQLDFSNINFCILRFYLDENTQIFHIPELATYLFEKTRKTIRKEYPSIMPKYSKMMLFGGKAETDSIVEIDIQENSVKIIGQLSIGKVDHCAEQIGDYVFVLGDAENEQVEKYDLEKNVSDVSEFRMSSRKDNYSSVLVSKQIYVIGGRLNSQSIDIVEYFDCENMKWYNAPKLLGSFSHHDSVEVDEAIYVVGDYKSQKFQRFDRREGKWSFLSDIPMKAYCTAMSSCDQRITCLGGGSMARLTRQVYDVRNEKWEQFRDMPNFTHGAKSVENETHIILAGGYFLDNIRSFDKDRNIWSNLNIKLPRSNWYFSKVFI